MVSRSAGRQDAGQMQNHHVTEKIESKTVKQYR